MKPLAASSASVTTAILAGGAGTRFGGIDKGLVELHGRPLVEWVIAALPVALHGRLLIVANRNIERYARHARTICDAQPGHAGPLAGIAAALQASDPPGPSPVPGAWTAPPPGLSARLWQEAARCGDNALVAHDGTRRQPLFALYRSRLAESAALSLQRDAGVSRWQDAIHAREVDVSGLAGTWTNVNSPADLADIPMNGNGSRRG